MLKVGGRGFWREWGKKMGDGIMGGDVCMNMEGRGDGGIFDK